MVCTDLELFAGSFEVFKHGFALFCVESLSEAEVLVQLLETLAREPREVRAVSQGAARASYTPWTRDWKLV